MLSGPIYVLDIRICFKTVLITTYRVDFIVDFCAGRQILVVLAAVLGTIIYRISIVSAVYGGSGGFLKKHAKIVTTITAATINLIMIMILTRVRCFPHFCFVFVFV